MREKEAKMAVYDSVLEAVGRTPLVRLCRFNDGKAELFAKVEGRNPGGSVKDRVGVAMIEAAERAGALAPGGLIIEPTSGNTGIGLAMAAAVKGYRLILTMPETMSVERRKLLAAYGAELVLTPGAKGMAGAIAEAERLHAANPGSIIPQQFENPANPAAHEASTGPEILEDLGGAPDVFVAGGGTRGPPTPARPPPPPGAPKDKAGGGPPPPPAATPGWASRPSASRGRTDCSSPTSARASTASPC